jgi:hypothetical protein
MARAWSAGDYCFLQIDGERWPVVIITEDMVMDEEDKAAMQPQSMPVFAIGKDTMYARNLDFGIRTN